MTNKKLYKKIKRNGILGSVIIFILTLVLIIVVVKYAGDAVIAYVIENKLSKEYDSIEYMARMYETGLKNGTENVYDFLNQDGHEYMIKDKSGKILYLNGTNTCSDKGDMAYLSVYHNNVQLYEDTEMNMFVFYNGSVCIDKEKFVKWSNSRESMENGLNVNFDPVIEFDEETENEASTQNDADDVSGLAYDYFINEEGIRDEDFFNLPVWMAVPVNDGKETLIGKGVLSLNIQDLTTISLITIFGVVLLFFIMVAFMIRTIRTAIRQKRMVNYFFTDAVTRGHNWMWYEIKGDEKIQSWGGRRTNLAVINLMLVNYRNYVVCHSVEDGEKLLRKVNQLIERTIGKQNMCARASASNFALMVAYDDIDELRSRITDMILQLEKIEEDHKFSFQAGISMIEKTGNDKESKKKRKEISINTEYNNACTARASISETDESGVVLFDEKLVEEQRWLDKVQERQSQAVANEEFLVYYQPKYDPRTNELRGAEALIRWQSPDLGFVTPFRFIPLFEKNGFITEIDHYMISHVARDQKRWLDKGYKCVPVSVNVSRAHFIESDLAEQIRDMIDKEGCPHELIEIELTESAFFDDKKAMINTINKLKSYGFAVSMDDFGSGYSSLNSLKDMPLDVLKLDAEFFRGDAEDGRAQVVVSEAIRLAKSLNMRTVAEGVEAREQVDFLAKEGCDMIQGYIFDKPMPYDKYEKKMVIN